MVVAGDLASVAAEASALQRQRDMDMALLMLMFSNTLFSSCDHSSLCSLLSELHLIVQQARLAFKALMQHMPAFCMLT